jgi:hypothetical protein
MSGFVNIIKIERIQLKSKIRTYSVLVDRRMIQDYFQEALINASGEKLVWASKKHVIVDGMQLLESGNGSGQFAIFNCTCGTGAECADLESTIDVEHEGDFIIWKYSAPGYRGTWFEKFEKKFKFKFHKPQYLNELKKIEPIDDLQGLPGYGPIFRR